MQDLSPNLLEVIKLQNTAFMYRDFSIKYKKGFLTFKCDRWGQIHVFHMTSYISDVHEYAVKSS